MQYVAWVTDPLETLDTARDTTLRLIREGIKLGIPQIHLDPSGIVRNDKLTLSGYDPNTGMSLSTCSLKAICYRVDPPVDRHYLHPLLILASSQIPIINPAAILTSWSEKTLGIAMELAPPSIISQNPDALFQFAQKYQDIIIKPLHRAQSRGIKRLRHVKRSQFENLKYPILLQRFLPGIYDGEIRIWYAGGEILGVLRKKPLQGDYRVNTDRGSTIERVTLTEQLRLKAEKAGAFLQKRGVRLAAIDYIEEQVTDCNVTSPGLLCEMEELLGCNLAEHILRELF